MKFLALLFFASLLYGEAYDFGVVGKQVDIIEENGDDFLKRKIKSLDIEKLNNELKESITEYSVSHVNLPASKVDDTVTKKDVYKAPYTITSPISNEVLYKKGEQISTTLERGIKFSLCFVDGKYNEAIMTKVVKAFGKECKYFVDNINPADFSKLFDVPSYPINNQNTIYLQRYGVDRLPMKITRFQDNLEQQTLDIERISIEVMEGR